MLTFTASTLRNINLNFNHGDALSAPDYAIALSVAKTLLYFDMFDFPLTAWEIYKYLWKDESGAEVSFGRLQSVLKNYHVDFGEKDGFYFLNNKDHLIALRKQRQIIAAKKYKRAQIIAKIFSLFPFVEMIAVSNSLSYDNARDDSDIDLFIITSDRKIWTARFFSAAFLKIFHLRPNAYNKKNKICLNFFVTANALNLRQLKENNDIYFIYWLHQLTPIYDAADLFSRFCQANSWIKNYIQAHDFNRINYQRRIKAGVISRVVKKIFQIMLIFNFWEILFRSLQMKKMPDFIKNSMNKSTNVVVNESTLKFHDQDRRAEFRHNWLVRCLKYENILKSASNQDARVNCSINSPHDI